MASREALKEWRETYGMKRDEARFFIDANMDFTQASEWLAASFEPHRAAMYYSERISIEDALRCEALSNGEMNEQNLSLYRKLAITVEEAEEWVRRGFSYIDPIMFTSYPFTEGERKFVMEVQGRHTLIPYLSEIRGLDKDLFVRDYDTAWQWRHAGFSGVEASDWIYHEFSPEEAAIWREVTRGEHYPYGNARVAYFAVKDELTPEEFLPWVNVHLRPKEWIDAGFTPEEVSAWGKACTLGRATGGNILTFIDFGMTPDDVKSWCDAGVWVDEIIDSLRGGYSLEQVKEWMAKGYKVRDMGVTGQELFHLRLDRANHWAREAIVYIDMASEATDDNRREYVSDAREAWALLSRQVEEMFAEIGESPVEV